MLEGQAHSYGGPCNNCEMIAKANAQRFFEERMLSQLATLKSDTTGLNGFVLPPRPILEHDKKPD
jgi:hypothetical protein